MVFQPAENDNDYSLVSGHKFPKGVTIVLKSVKEYIIIKKRNHLKVAFLFYFDYVDRRDNIKPPPMGARN